MPRALSRPREKSGSRMKLILRNPSLPVLMGWILLGLSVHKGERRRTWRAGIETTPDSGAPGARGGGDRSTVMQFPERFRQARRLWQLRGPHGEANPLSRM